MPNRMRQLLAAVVALVLVSPVAASPSKSSASGPEIAGIVAAADSAIVREAGAPAGTTIFSGDTLRTFSGSAIVAIGESQVRFGAESRARLLRDLGDIEGAARAIASRRDKSEGSARAALDLELGELLLDRLDRPDEALTAVAQMLDTTPTDAGAGRHRTSAGLTRPASVHVEPRSSE